MKELFDCQKEVLAEVKDRDTCAFYCAPGTGKTMMGLEKIRTVGKSHNLIVCQKSKVEDWIEDCKSQLPEFNVVNLTKGAIPEQLPDMTVGVINYDLLWRRDTFLKWRDFNLTLDESSVLQNATSKRSKFITKLKPSSIQLLSGTPVGGKYEKLYTQMKLLGYNRNYMYFFKRYTSYVELPVPGTNKTFKMVVGYKNVTELRTVLRDLGCVFRTLEEMVDVPECVTQTLYVNPPKEYKTYIKDRIVKIGDELFVGDTVLKLRLMATEICSYMNKEKERVFGDLLDTLENERVVVFYRFDRDLECIKHIAESHGRPISEVNGHVKNRTAFDENENGLIAVQYQAGARGLNLQNAHYLIYWGYTDDYDLWEQSHDRIRRIGQGEKQVYYQIVNRGSVEEDIIANVNNKQSYNDKLFEKRFL